MNEPEALKRFEAERVARFATITETGRPHIVPITFAVVDDQIVHMVDHKPKQSSQLKRLANVRLNPHASLLADHYEDDWSRLWWVRVDGTAIVVSRGAEWESARVALAGKYHQYRERPPTGPAVLLTIERITYWEGSE
ncbi:MAG: TIGR03668 family PPOX class F420-dependent oxidoreductase [Acidimicrobiia bacterium]